MFYAIPMVVAIILAIIADKYAKERNPKPFDFVWGYFVAIGSALYNFLFFVLIMIEYFNNTKAETLIAAILCLFGVVLYYPMFTLHFFRILQTECHRL
ncbi:MAG: hypothetical protein P8P30_08815 [Rickettsiales bacterium]|nr:hypothetical protein [Rickettsiales bacterium]